MVSAFQAPAPHTFRLPIRLVEARFGLDNFDDCGDAVVAELVGLLDLVPGQLRLDWDFDDAHPNPWFHTLNFSVKLQRSELAPQVVAMLHRLALLDPLEQVLDQGAGRRRTRQGKRQKQGQNSGQSKP